MASTNLEEQKLNPNSSNPINEEFYHTAFNNIEEQGRRLYRQDQRITFIIGDSHSGKSTLSNLLAGCQLKATTDEVNWYFTGRTHERTQIGQGVTSTTTLPIRIEGSDGRTIYNDFPGFFDTRGPEKELACNFYLRALIESVDKFRILLVINCNVLRESSSRLIGIASHLQSLFDDVDQLLEGLFVVVTKCRPTAKIEGIQGLVRRVIEENPGLEEKTLAVLKMIAGREGRVELFREPREEGDFDGESVVKSITGKLEDVSYIEKQNINIRMSLATKEHANKVISQIKRKIGEEVEKMVQKVEEICREKVRTSSFNELKRFTEKAQNDINVNFNVNASSNQEAGEGYCKLMNYIQVIQEYTSEGVAPYDERSIRRAIHCLSIFSELNIPIEAQDFSRRFLNLKESLRKVTSTVLAFSDDTSVLTIKGVVVDLRAFTDLLKRDDLKRAEIYCLHAIFLEEISIECRGVDIAIISPIWKIKGSNSINMTGRRVFPPLPRGNNADGNPGRPGNNGGNFIGVMKELIREGNAKIRIKVNGGDGENGENGLSLAQIREMRSQEEHKSQPLTGMSAMHPGKGGPGGPGGSPGIVRIYEGEEEKLNGLEGLKIERKPGLEGFSGPEGPKIQPKKPKEVESITCKLLGGIMRSSDDDSEKKKAKPKDAMRPSAGITEFRPSMDTRAGDTRNLPVSFSIGMDEAGVENRTNVRHENILDETWTIPDEEREGINLEDEAEEIERQEADFPWKKNELEGKYREYYSDVREKDMEFIIKAV